jgi:DNA gyrase/topoisomerase IV subunit A
LFIFGGLEQCTGGSCLQRNNCTSIAGRSSRNGARVVGDLIGGSIRMATIPFAMHCFASAPDFAPALPLADGRSSFGNVGGNHLAAMRCTEARLTEGACPSARRPR